MRHGESTQQGSQSREDLDASAPAPGLVLVFAEDRPAAAALPVQGELVLGRGVCAGVALKDVRLSREHAAVRFDADGFAVQDRGSRNGSAVDGRPARADAWIPLRRVLRLGDSLFLAVGDVRPYQRPDPVRVGDGRVTGPGLQAALTAVARAASFGATVYLHGESGVGKEGAARHFHAQGPRPGGPFVAVNCAAIPSGIAERLLFGARKGAYSGADEHSEGYVQAASGGTLFLDEVAELDLQVQAKLLRVLDSREVLALGATRARAIDLRVCSATHKDLAAEVRAGRLREDLYYRIGRPEVAIAALRERLEEVPWLLDAAVQAVDGGLRPHPSLIETCMLRHWPGNVRELMIEARVAAQEALADGAPKVQPRHLGARAGLVHARDEPPDPVDHVRAFKLRADPRSREAKPALAAVLRMAQGNVSRAARLLGLHRTQLRRLLAHHDLE